CDNLYRRLEGRKLVDAPRERVQRRSALTLDSIIEVQGGPRVRTRVRRGCGRERSLEARLRSREVADAMIELGHPDQQLRVRGLEQQRFLERPARRVEIAHVELDTGEARKAGVVVGEPFDVAAESGA